MNSKLVTNSADKDWLISQLPQKPKSLVLLFSTFDHGFKQAYWRNAVKGKSQTITIMKTTKGKVCGGYLQVAWRDDVSYEFGCDSSAFVFSVDNRLKLTPRDHNKAVYFD